MNWYYAEAGQQAGPIDDARLEEMFRAGQIQTATLVWCEGMENWRPYGEVRPGSSPANPVPASVTAGLDEAVCAECGRVFKKQDMIPHGSIHVCAGCKPILMQKLAEGVALKTGALNYASVPTRFGAVLLDGLLLAVVNVALNLAVGMGMFQSAATQPLGLGPLQIGVFFVELLIGITYEVVLIGKYGATLGKMACKIRVVTGEGGRVSYLRAFGRYFAKMLSGLICMAGYIMAIFDDEKRALHDRICDTRVVLRE